MEDEEEMYDERDEERFTLHLLSSFSLLSFFCRTELDSINNNDSWNSASRDFWPEREEKNKKDLRERDGQENKKGESEWLSLRKKGDDDDQEP